MYILKGGIKRKMLNQNNFEPKKIDPIVDTFRFPMSGGFNQTIRCDNQTCPYHNKGRYCSSPSVVRIGAGGLCVPYREWLVKATKEE